MISCRHSGDVRTPLKRFKICNVLNNLTYTYTGMRVNNINENAHVSVLFRFRLIKKPYYTYMINGINIYDASENNDFWNVVGHGNIIVMLFMNSILIISTTYFVI